MRKGWSALRDSSELSPPAHPRGMALPRTACSIVQPECGRRGRGPIRNKLDKIFTSLVLYANFQLFGNKRKEQSDVPSD